MEWLPAVVCALVGAGVGLCVPELIGRIPEPDEDPPVDETASVVSRSETTVKEPYAAIAGLPGLRPRAAAVSALAAGLIAGRLGWTWALSPLLYLAPVGVALAVVDWRTRLLPRSVVAPSYAVVGGLVTLGCVLAGDWIDLRRAALGWAAYGGFFVLLWLVHPRGMGYGDVRLAGLLGIALGMLGWGELIVGLFAGFLIGGIAGVILTLRRRVEGRAFPFGPFMLLGALAGVVVGEPVARWYLGG